MERPPHTTEHKPPRREARFGLPGHEYEYAFVLEDNEQLPYGFWEVLEQELGHDWEILDRGTRIEIRNRKKLGTRDDVKINAAIEKAFQGLPDPLATDDEPSSDNPASA